MKKLILLWALFGFSKAFAQSENSFIYTNQEVKIELKIDGGKTALQHKEKNRITLSFKNIDPRTLTCSAQGLRIIKGSSDENLPSVWEIDLANFEKSSYRLLFSYMKNGERFSGEFKLPIAVN